MSDAEFGPLLDWPGALVPARTTLMGRHVTLEPLEPRRHGQALFHAAHGEPGDPGLWAYLAYGPFPDQATFEHWLWQQAGVLDPIYYAVVPRGSEAAGLATFLRVEPRAGSIEIGHLVFTSRLQRTPAATEAIYLMAAYAFDTLGYRRLEWKCNARNTRSRRAAERYGFTFEGIFRQARVDRGRSRDTAWFAIVDDDWPPLRAAFGAWLDPANFDAAGRQKRSLVACRS